jgi:hypothetical protein
MIISNQAARIASLEASLASKLQVEVGAGLVKVIFDASST